MAAPPLRALFRYQQGGVRFLAERNFALLAYEMGLGKTPVAIRAADAVGARRIVVVCPAIARRNWQREFDAWSQTPRKIHVVTKASEPIPSDADVVIVSFDGALRPVARNTLMFGTYDVLIVDECHFLKERSTKRTEMVYGENANGTGLISRATRCWLLSGTPAPNHAGELWPLLRAGAPGFLTQLNSPKPMDYWTFVKRYTNARRTRFGWQFSGLKSKHKPELQSILRRVMLRALAKDELDLPPLVVDDYPVEVDAKLLKTLTALNRDPEYARIIGAAKSLADETFDLDDYKDKLSMIRRITGMIKAPLVVEKVAADLAADPTLKIVVFAWHREVLDALQGGLTQFGCSRVDGQTLDLARTEAVDRFQNDPTVRVFIAQIQSCSTAITLTAARLAIFAEASFVPSDNAQAVKRIHRIGQTSGCLALFFSLYGSIDELITRIVRNKTRHLTALFDSLEPSMTPTNPDAYSIAITAIADITNRSAATIAAIYAAATGVDLKMPDTSPVALAVPTPTAPAATSGPSDDDKLAASALAKMEASAAAEKAAAEKKAAADKKAAAEKRAAEKKAAADKAAADKKAADTSGGDPLDLDLGDDDTGAGDSDDGGDGGSPLTMTDVGAVVNEAVETSGAPAVKAVLKSLGLNRARDAEGDQAKIDALHKALSALT